MKVVSSPKQRRNFRFYRDDDGGACAGERVSLGGSAIQSTANAARDVCDKPSVMSNQTQRRSTGQQAGQASGRRHGWADHSNPYSSQVVGGSFGQKGGLGPQGPNRELGPLQDPKGDPITLRPFLKGKKSFGSRSNPSPISHVMEGPSVISKEGGFQTNPFQALRTQFEESTLEDLRAALEGGATIDIEKEGERVPVIESS